MNRKELNAPSAYTGLGFARSLVLRLIINVHSGIEKGMIILESRVQNLFFTGETN